MFDGKLRREIRALQERTRLTGAKFEKVIGSLPAERQTAETAHTILLVATVSAMDITVRQDLSAESEDRAARAAQHETSAASFRQRAEREDQCAERERSRATEVYGLMSLLLLDEPQG